MPNAPTPAPGVRPPVAPRRQGGVQYVEDFFAYTLVFSAMAPGDVDQQSIQIQADSHFKWTKATFQADIAADAYLDGTRPIPLISLQITDSGSGRQLFFNPLPVETIFGTGQLPFILPIPRIFMARSTIQVVASNFDAAVTYNLRLAFIGTKIFDM